MKDKLSFLSRCRSRPRKVATLSPALRPLTRANPRFRQNPTSSSFPGGFEPVWCRHGSIDRSFPYASTTVDLPLPCISCAFSPRNYYWTTAEFVVKFSQFTTCSATSDCSDKHYSKAINNVGISTPSGNGKASYRSS